MELSRREFLQYSGALVAGTAFNSQLVSSLLATTGTNGPPLRSLAQRIIGPSGKLFKIGLAPEAGDTNDPTGIPEQQTALQFNHRPHLWVSMPSCYYGPNQWNFSWADSMIQKIQAANQSMIGMHLLWGSSALGAIPNWILNGGYNRNQLIAIIQAHISTVMTRYKGKIAAYTVVNEYWNGDGMYDWWYQQIGPDYFQIAFQTARQADPTAVLIFNHYSNETASSSYYATTKNCIDALKTQSLVDAVGIQMHLWFSRPTKADVISAMQSYGVPVWVTEFDSFQLLAPYLPPGMTAEQEQAMITQNMIEAALESGVCDCFTNWGFSDKNSWWNNYYGGNYNPCLWDANNNAKLNYYAIQQTLSTKMTFVNDIFLPLVGK